MFFIYWKVKLYGQFNFERENENVDKQQIRHQLYVLYQLSAVSHFCQKTDIIKYEVRPDPVALQLYNTNATHT